MKKAWLLVALATSFFASVAGASRLGGGAPDLERLRSWAREAEESAKSWWDEVFQKNETVKAGPIYLGIVVEPVPSILREHIDLPAGIGLVVRDVKTGSPAEAGGLEANDILIAYGTQLLVNHEQLLVLLGLEVPGAEVVLDVLRRGEELQIKVRLRSEAPDAANGEGAQAQDSNG
jgi:hypothetical protein